jgi:hypothetical protein
MRQQEIFFKSLVILKFVYVNDKFIEVIKQWSDSIHVTSDPAHCWIVVILHLDFSDNNSSYVSPRAYTQIIWSYLLTT